MIETRIVNGLKISFLWKANSWTVPDSIFLDQVHGTRVVYEPKKLWVKWDAIVARYGIWPYAIKIVDCMWVCIVWKQYYSMIHVWRRGLYQWLIHSTVQKMYRQWERVMDMQVLISPCNHLLEVGRDWIDFRALVPDTFLRKNADWFDEIDMVAWATQQLCFQWIIYELIRVHPDDTLINNDRWYSNRIEWTKRKNRMLVENI